MFAFSCFFDKTEINLKNMLEEKFVDVATSFSYLLVFYCINFTRV